MEGAFVVKSKGQSQKERTTFAGFVVASALTGEVKIIELGSGKVCKKHNLLFGSEVCPECQNQ